MAEVRLTAYPLTRGEARGEVTSLAEPVSFWGGVNARGTVVDAHHPDRGISLSGRVLVMSGGRGSSSSSTVLAELIRAGVGPLAVVLGRHDPIIALGAMVAAELYGIAVPVVAVGAEELNRVRGTVRVSSHPAAGAAAVVLGAR